MPDEPGVTREAGQVPPEEPKIGRHVAALLRKLLDERGIEPARQASYLARLPDPERPGKTIGHVPVTTSWLNDRRDGWMLPRNIRALEHHLGIPGMLLVEANAADLNITWGKRGRPTAWWAPSAFYALPDEDQARVVEIFSTAVGALAQARGIAP